MPHREPLCVTADAYGAHAVAAYYDEMQRFYGRLWHPTGVHYGLWEHGVSSHDESIRRMDTLVGRTLDLLPGSRVLDAGCGIGGSCFHLARQYEYEMVGLTISHDQLRRARRRVTRFEGTHVPEFQLRPYTATGYPDHHFHGVFGIESVCYAAPKSAFLEEAHRILRPLGRLVVLDGFATPEPCAADRRDLHTFCRGFALTGLSTIDDFVSDTHAAGFVDVRVEDLTERVLRSAVRIRWLSRLGAALLAVPKLFGPIPTVWEAHCRAGLVQHRLLRRGGMRYCAVSATRL